jgi:dihydroorotate dehydrogenase electron transfer subunit|nr:dihydroorotate dehydrogenase electron transfer subunit [uncultured Oscillibacter sp.]
MKQSLFTLEHTRQLTADTYELVLSGDTSAITAPGQFVNIELPGKFLRRPISICNWSSEGALMLLVKVVGDGTKQLVRCVPGTELDVLSGLGNGFNLTLAGQHPILLGGGIGIAPLYGLAQRMLQAGMTPTVGLGFRSQADAFYLEEFGALGCRLMVATEDGSLGTRGFVTDIARNVPECDYVLCCGPLPMLKAVHALPQLTGGQFSFEARMGCGFGACVGCSVPTVQGTKRVCKDGPILYKEEIVW